MLNFKLYIYVGIVFIILLITASSLSYYMGRSDGKLIVERKVNEENIKALRQNSIELVEQQQVFNESVTALNNALSKHSQTVKIIQTNTLKEIEKPMYREVVPESGYQLIMDSAIALNDKRVSVVVK